MLNGILFIAAITTTLFNFIPSKESPDALGAGNRLSDYLKEGAGRTFTTLACATFLTIVWVTLETSLIFLAGAQDFGYTPSLFRSGCASLIGCNLGAYGMIARSYKQNRSRVH